jgi:hypothetical protein
VAEEMAAGEKGLAVRAALVDAYNIPTYAPALLNEKPVDAYVLQPGDVLEFVRG